MQIEYRDTGRLVPYENNPRTNDQAVERLAALIREYGFRVPILVDAEGVIIAGHTRLKAAQHLGLEQVPVVTADDLTPEQVRALRIADNASQEWSNWDLDLLRVEVQGLSDVDYSLDLTGLEQAVVRALFPDVEWLDDEPQGARNESKALRITVVVDETRYNDCKREVARVAQEFSAKVL